MTLSYIKIDYDIVDKVQALFDKYGINFNYRKNIIDKLNKYAETNRGLADAYNNYDSIGVNDKIYAISINDCKKWKRKLKSVGLQLSFDYNAIVYFRNGMVDGVNGILSLKDMLTNNIVDLLISKVVYGVYENDKLKSLEELEEKLERIDRNVNEYVKFFKSKTYKKYFDLLNQSLNKFETEQKIYESSLNKITNGLVKLVDIENEK